MKRRNLPMFAVPPTATTRGGPPTLEEARSQLGGLWRGSVDVGRLIAIDGERAGMVIHGYHERRDVWCPEGAVHRVEAARCLSLDPDLLPEATLQRLDRVGADARVYASLEPRQPVLCQDRDRAVHQGTLIEKLRYGGLVGMADGSVRAVSFRRITPVGVNRA